jgi:DNA replication protein DnaC
MPRIGKGHLSAAFDLALVGNGWRVLFVRTADLVQRLQAARHELVLEAAIAKFDVACVAKNWAETSVLFELIAGRLRRPMAHLVFTLIVAR